MARRHGVGECSNVHGLVVVDFRDRRLHPVVRVCLFQLNSAGAIDVYQLVWGVGSSLSAAVAISWNRGCARGFSPARASRFRYPQLYLFAKIKAISINVDCV